MALGVATGFVGSLNTPQIQASFPFALTVNGWGAAFWLFFIGTAASFLLHQRAAHNARDRAQAKLEEAHEKLPDLIRTMPPSDFLNRMTAHFEKVDVVGRLAKNDADAVLKVLGVALESIALLAAQYDDCSGNPTYGANIMVFVSGDAARRWETLIRFAGLASPTNSRNARPTSRAVRHTKWGRRSIAQ